MLDIDTKHRIDTARDILVGKVPDPKSQVESSVIHYMVHKCSRTHNNQTRKVEGFNNPAVAVNLAGDKPHQAAGRLVWGNCPAHSAAHS